MKLVVFELNEEILLYLRGNMAKDLPYTVVAGKISELFKKISEAKVPDTFSHAFLRDTLGYKSTNDRSIVGVLKALG
ncbi:DUF5343 domain-containing protein, partial [Salmonella enterica]|uniref:DUF5343 domain-containing protein n=1 Tax=Salmonella enterica TaxID=28901 RepID=UPI001E3EC55C